MDRSIRVFFAIELTPALKLAVENYMLELQKQLKSHKIRWTLPQHLHITLQFLAKLSLQDLPLLLSHVKQEIQQPPFELELKQLELFPTPNQPRVLSLHLEPQDLLQKLSICIGQGIATLGYPVETRPYRGHITLARLNETYQLPLESPVFEKMVVSEVLLYQSQPTATGSFYSILDKIALI